MRSRVAGLVAIALGSAGLLLPVGPFAQGADGQAAASVSGVAAAAGFNAIVEVPQFLPLGDVLVDLGIPTAQAVLETGSGQRSGFASLPDPGELILTLPGTAAGLVGGLGSLPAPSYPLAVSSTAESPVARFADPAGVIVLDARSNPQRVDATASITNPGATPSVGKVQSSATVVQDDGGTVRAIAETKIEGFALDVAGISIRLGVITSRSTTTWAPGDDEPTSDTDFDIAGATINGLGVSIGPDGVSLLGQTIPLPLGVVGDAIDGLLAAAGVDLEVVSVEDTDGGRASQYLEITTSQKIPIPGEPVGNVYLRVGRVETSLITGAALDDVDLGGEGEGEGSAPIDGGGFPASPDLGGSGSISLPELGGAEPGVGGRAPALDEEPALFARDLRPTFRFFYSVLIVGGLAGVAASSIWRTKGVRARWMP